MSQVCDFCQRKATRIDWLADRQAIGHVFLMSGLVNKILSDSGKRRNQKITRNYGRTGNALNQAS